MISVDYSAPAELFPTKNGKTRIFRYQRFSSAAQAVRFAIEQMPAKLLNGSFIQVDEQRFSGADIKTLYAAERYPLPRVRALE